MADKKSYTKAIGQITSIMAMVNKSQKIIRSLKVISYMERSKDMVITPGPIKPYSKVNFYLIRGMDKVIVFGLMDARIVDSGTTIKCTVMESINYLMVASMKVNSLKIKSRA